MNRGFNTEVKSRKKRLITSGLTVLAGFLIAGCAGASAGDDGGNDGGGEADSPANYVFVTSTLQAPGELGGLAGADSLCQARASAAGLEGTYVAWLSTSTTDAKDRLGSARGWVRTDGRAVADTVAELTSRLAWYPISVDEYGNRVTGELRVATGTRSTGQVSGTSTCSDWTSSAGTVEVGNILWTSDIWTENGTRDCSIPVRLYCFGVDRQVATVPRVNSGRIAFLSSPSFTSGGGISSADALCASEAASNSLPGSYKAWMATSTESAASRFDTVNDTRGWVRTDGLVVFETASDMLSSEMIAPITAYADGSVDRQRQSPKTGASSPTATATGSSNCSDWTSAADSEFAVWGSNVSTGARAFNNVSNSPCDFTTRVYCLQE